MIERAVIEMADASASNYQKLYFYTILEHTDNAVHIVEIKDVIDNNEKSFHKYESTDFEEARSIFLELIGEYWLDGWTLKLKEK